MGESFKKIERVGRKIICITWRIFLTPYVLCNAVLYCACYEISGTSFL